MRMRPYTILYFMDYGKSFGGAANTLIRQAVLMQEAGHNVIVFFSDYLGQCTSEECEKLYSGYSVKMIVATYQISSQPEDIDVICMDRHYEELRDVVKQYKPDILHSVQINPMVELIGRELGIPHIMNVYPLLPEFFSLKYMDIFPHYHVCDSWYWAKRWHKYLGTDYTCIRTVVNMERVYKIIPSDRRVRYICAGQVSEGKNQLEVIKAFHMAVKAGISGELVICGYDISPYAEECRRYIRDNELEQYVMIKGFCSDMGTVYKSSDVLICGSKRESYPNVISEAMAYGLVIISTPVAGIPEVVEDGVNGYLTDGYTAEAIEKKILELNHDIGTEKLREIRRKEAETFRTCHSPKSVTEQLLNYYGHVVLDYQVRDKTGIVDIRKKFASWNNIFYQNCKCFTKPQMAALKIWYLSYVKDDIISAFRKGVEIYLWGTGNYGVIAKEIIAVFLPEIKVQGFLDSKRTGKFGEYEIYHPEEILKRENIVVLVALLNGQNEVVYQMKNHGMLFNRDYFILSPRLW